MVGNQPKFNREKPMDLEEIKKQSQDQIAELSKLMTKQNRSILDQSNQMIKDMQSHMGSIYQPPKMEPSLKEIIDRLDRIDLALIELQKKD